LKGVGGVGQPPARHRPAPEHFAKSIYGEVVKLIY
jgi:hypothetical protein